ncbi:sodium-dependent noradrenaline transporter-like isoform X2 [Periplaneta americana]|uniref:sodium-dependent noradrenaline transporter-like isoform X2 n=1 Tax=Periplaneta americana TaxID=6978 RepID=UPI0037E7386E
MKLERIETFMKWRQLKSRYPSEIFDTECCVRPKEGPRPPKTTRWNSHEHFMTSAICYSMGISCWWRFPTYALRYDGGAFLYVYAFLLIVIGHPLLYFEVILGKITNKGSDNVFRLCPFIEGLGIAMALVSSYMSLYFGIITSYTTMYMLSSINPNFVWMICDKAPCWNKTNDSNAIIPPENYFYKTVVGTRNVEDSNWIHNINWTIVAILLVIWICVYICLAIDIRSCSMLGTILAITMYILIIPIFLATQKGKGALEGTKKLFTPPFNKMKNVALWSDALEQVFFSLALATGPAISFGSYSQFMHPVYGNCICICCMVLVMSTVMATITFNSLGILATYTESKNLSTIIKKGPGSVFILYSLALTELPFLQGWAVVTYAAATVTAIFTMSVVLEIVLSMLCRSFKFFRKNRPLASATITGVLFVLSLPGTSKVGLEMIMVLDEYPVGRSLSLIAFCEMLTVILCLGAHVLSDRSLFKFGKPISLFYQYSWIYLPVVLFLLVVISFVPGENLIYSSSANAAGWILYSIVVLAIVTKAIYNSVQFTRRSVFLDVFSLREPENGDEVPKFSNAPPPNDRPKLVPSPVECPLRDRSN